MEVSMETRSKSRRSVRRRITGAALGVLFAGTIATVGASPALAENDGWMWIGVSADNRVDVQQNSGNSGTYHIDIWYAANGARYGGTGDYQYSGGTRGQKFGSHASVAGKRLCAKLWYYNPNTADWDSHGSPCHTD